MSIKGVNAKCAAMTVVSKPWNSTIRILLKRILAFPVKVMREAGSGLSKKLINVFLFVPIVIEKFMLETQLLAETLVDKAG